MINNALFKETILCTHFCLSPPHRLPLDNPNPFSFYPATLQHKRGPCGEENTSYFIRKQTHGMTYKDELILAIE